MGKHTEKSIITDIQDKKYVSEWVIDYPSGLHARPSSVWTECAKQLGASIQVRHQQNVAFAENMVELLQLGLKNGDVVILSTDQSAEKLEAFKQMIASLSLKEQNDAEHVRIQRKKSKKLGWKPPELSEIAILHGVSASPGFAIGQSYHLTRYCPVVPDIPMDSKQSSIILSAAIQAAKEHLQKLIKQTENRLGKHNAEIFKAHLLLLEDVELTNIANQYIMDGHGVAWSWLQSIEFHVKRLLLSNNTALAERTADLRDIGNSVLGYIDPSLKRNTLGDLPEGNWILTATDLSPSETVLLDPDKVKGLVTIFGGPTSHTAILARTLGIPAIVAAGEAVAHVENGSTMIIDGDGATIYVNPSKTNLLSATEWIKAQEHKHKLEEAQRQQPAKTLDGHIIKVVANVNRPEQIPFAMTQGAEGVGLMRTEFLFLESTHIPSEDEQALIYQAMIEQLDGLPLTIRALDIGGDKNVEHLHLPYEDNPFLGVRGARLLLRRMDLLLPQLKALYRAAKLGQQLSIMFPMITSVTEFLTLKSYCEGVRQSLNAPVIPIGIMIEVPSAAIMADIFAEHVDFFSIGTNDLTQYTLAIDRQNPELAAEADSLHPAVLRLIQKTITGAKLYDKPVGVCGSLAGDPLGAMILTGLGIDELSMTPRDIATVKAELRAHSLIDMQKLANLALAQDCAVDVRALVENI
ncbi:phosphoenolpyruvate--protein phosphotransferase [Wohlfahrtiimonas larvae]|uniref:phosphoenolpyruvate--protein phosphotransferase n=1 Tax=Wohlfahrtiimonas larvae TaxID=1157986 RepID=A0ABP9MIZ8_9GAMM|nr:phosphoenolpyruvate--protein phosphotransferase [Wohlfahrtiimonas larvae]